MESYAALVQDLGLYTVTVLAGLFKEESIYYDWTNITGTSDSIWHLFQVIYL